MPEIDIAVWLIAIIIMSFVFMMLSPYMLGVQARIGIGQLRKSVAELQARAKESRKIALGAIAKHGKPKRDVEKEFDNFLEFFAIEPVSDDPSGVLRRLEHVLDVRKRRFEGVVARLAPNADPESAANLEMVIEGAMANYALYRFMRHFTLLAEKTKNMQLVMLVQLNVPFLKEYSKAFVDATRAFAAGKPIGDGVGALTAAKLIDKAKWQEPVEDTVYAETKFDGRKLIVVKAKGPGGRVGKPGELVKRLIQKRKVSRIIMIDAAGKLEGETSGQVIEGVGAAIGGPPTEKHKIEEIATGRKIPVDAIVIKESFTEAIKPLNKRLAKGVDVAIDTVKKAVRERTKPGDVVIVTGIGNTIGIGQGLRETPKEFPAPPEKEKGEIESSLLPLR
ncbi:MAG: DUF1512 domain-containing protein [Hadesarchaea archaeon]|nr:DUF1512 domain-containing protein [Hadesarchaea archaeon]